MIEVDKIGNDYHIKWTNDVVDVEIYNRMSKYVDGLTTYIPMNSAENINKLINDFEPQINIKPQQLVSMYNILTRKKAIASLYKIANILQLATERYILGKDIVDIASKFSIPPCILLKNILINLNRNQQLMNSIFSDRICIEDARDQLTPYDYEQIIMARESDGESTYNQKKIALIAEFNEKLFVDYFKNLGINIKTQNDFTEEQKYEHGKALFTPDLYFIDTVFINGQRIYWIDYKDYMGTCANFLFDSNLKQSKRYFDEFGTGAMCYQYSFTNIEIPDTMLLDGSAIPVNFIYHPTN